MLSSTDLESLQLVHAGTCIARPTVGFSWFMEPPLSAFSKQALQAKDEFLSWVGEGSLRHYATETMSKHRPVNKRALTSVAAWFSEGAPAQNTLGIEYSDADPFNAAPSVRFELSGDEVYEGERGMLASLVRCSVPSAWGVERPAELLDFARRLSELLPFQSGSVGYAFECSRYFELESMEHAWATSMRHPGIDIHQEHDVHAVARDGVRGVNWLTLLSSARLKQLGKLPSFALCKVHELADGVMIQAGDAPAIGDVNHGDTLPAYREAFEFIEPLTPAVFERSPWVHLTRDKDERTQAWYERFSNGA